MSPRVRKALEACDDLPTMPAIAARVVEMGRDPELNIGDLAALLTKDPALAARLLRVANSAFYSRRRRSENVMQAVMLLGLDTTITLALSFSLVETLRTAGGAGRMVWRRALLAGTACQQLGHYQDRASPEALFLAGLLQDIGVLALEAAVPDDYGPLVREADSHDALVALEQVYLDTDHCEAGAWLMDRWGLPEYVVEAVRGSHDPESAAIAESSRDQVRCVALSGQIADFFLHGHDRAEASGVLADTAAEWLGLGANHVADIIGEIADRLPEIETLYETRLFTPGMIKRLTDEARRLLVMRNLQLLQETAEPGDKEPSTETASADEDAARRDPLTGVYNGAFLKGRLAHEFRLATEGKWPLSVGFVHVDGLAAVGERFGREAADYLLSMVAKLIAGGLRDRDVVARYDDQAFLVMLPATPLDDALSVFARLQRMVAERSFRGSDGESLSLTICVGAAAHMDEDRYYGGTDPLLEDAARALRVAENRGPNRLESLFTGELAG